MENNESQFVADLVSDLCSNDPRTSVDILNAIITMPKVKDYITSRGAEMDDLITFTVPRGSLPFIMGACMIGIGDMSMNAHAKHFGCTHARMFEKYADAVVSIAERILDDGYPDKMIVTEMTNAIRIFHNISKRTDEILEKVKTGEVTMGNINDTVKKVFNE